jgi:hypothetical protein
MKKSLTGPRELILGTGGVKGGTVFPLPHGRTFFLSDKPDLIPVEPEKHLFMYFSVVTSLQFQWSQWYPVTTDSPYGEVNL